MSQLDRELQEAQMDNEDARRECEEDERNTGRPSGKADGGRGAVLLTPAPLEPIGRHDLTPGF